MKLPQQTNDTENTLKALGKLSRRVATLQSTGAEPSTDVLIEMFDELGRALDEAPIIPAGTYTRFKARIKERILYSMFDQD
jgi:hypothetical protein